MPYGATRPQWEWPLACLSSLIVLKNYNPNKKKHWFTIQLHSLSFFENMIFLIYFLFFSNLLKNSIWGTHCEIALKWIPHKLTKREVKIASGNGLVPSSKKPSLESMSIQICNYMITRPQWVNSSYRWTIFNTHPTKVEFLVVNNDACVPNAIQLLPCKRKPKPSSLMQLISFSKFNQYSSLTLNVQGPSYLCWTGSISWLLMP